MTRGWGTSRTLDNTREELRDTRKNQVAGQVLAETGSRSNTDAWMASELGT